MELRHLRIFRCCGRNLNFTKAAQKLHLARLPSPQIHNLEQELGALLSRPKATLPALEGRSFLREARRLLALASESVAEMITRFAAVHSSS